MDEIASKGDSGFNKLIEAGGVEALVEMAKQENTPNGRFNIAVLMGKIAQKGDAGVKALVDKGGVEALVKMAKQESIPETEEQVSSKYCGCNGSNCKNRRCWSKGIGRQRVGLRHWLQWPSRKISQGDDQILRL